MIVKDEMSEEASSVSVPFTINIEWDRADGTHARHLRRVRVHDRLERTQCNFQSHILSDHIVILVIIISQISNDNYLDMLI